MKDQLVEMPLLNNTQRSQKADIHATSGIRTRNPSMRGARNHALDGTATGVGKSQ